MTGEEIENQVRKSARVHQSDNYILTKITMSKDAKKLGVFERMKKIEEAKKKRATARILTKVKELAQQVQENKLLCELYLEQVIADPKEQKQIIDWINELDDVKPDEDRVKELRDVTKMEAKEEKKQVEKKIKEDPEQFMRNLELTSAYYSSPSLVTNGMTTDSYTFTSGTMDQVLCSNAAGIDVK